MNSRLLERITKIVAITGVLLVLVSGMIYGVDGALGALVGAVVANVNWLSIRWVTKLLASGDVRTKNRLMVLLGFKSLFVLTFCWLLLTRLGLHTHGFVIGITALVLGVVIGPLTMPESSSPASNGAD